MHLALQPTSDSCNPITVRVNLQATRANYTCNLCICSTQDICVITRFVGVTPCVIATELVVRIDCGNVLHVLGSICNGHPTSSTKLVMGQVFAHDQHNDVAENKQATVQRWGPLRLLSIVAGLALVTLVLNTGNIMAFFIKRLAYFGQLVHPGLRFSTLMYLH